MAKLEIKTLSQETSRVGNNSGTICKRIIRTANKLPVRMFKTIYESTNGSTRTNYVIQMFTDANGWVFIANSYDIGFEPISYVSSESAQTKKIIEFHQKADNYLNKLFGE